MIRLYPERMAELRRRQEAAVTPKYNAMPGGSEPSRTTEELGTASLGKAVDREVAAVRYAIRHTEFLRDGPERIHLIDLVYWKKTHTLAGASEACHISERTGRQWHSEFIHTVAKFRDLE